MSDPTGRECPLTELPVGTGGRIVRLEGSPALVQRTQELGLFEGEDVVVVRVAPLGDPIAVAAAGLPVSLRRREAAGIIVAPHAAGSRPS